MTRARTRGSPTSRRARLPRRPRSPRARSGPRAPSRVEDRTVSRAAYGGDVARAVGIIAKLVAQTADIHVDSPIEHLGLVLSIERVEEHLTRDDPAAGPHECREEAEFGLRERNALSRTTDLVTIEVDRQIAERKGPPHRLLARPGASQDGLPADDELRGSAGLRQVVVGAARDAGYPVGSASPCRQHEHRDVGLRACGAN